MIPLGFPLLAQMASPATTSSTPVDDIRDIHGILMQPFPWFWVILILSVCGVALLVGLIWFWLSWRKTRRKIQQLQSHEIALKQLEEAANLMESGEAREFSILVSDAVRTYLEKCFQVNASRRTTDEFLNSLILDEKSLLREYSEFLKDFLGYCDLAKFAKGELTRDQMSSMLESARDLVRRTRPETEGRKPQ